MDALGNTISLTYPSGSGLSQVTTLMDGYNRQGTVSADSAQRGQMTYDEVNGTSVNTSLLLHNGATTSMTMNLGWLANVTFGVASGLPDNPSLAQKGNTQSNDLTWTPGGEVALSGAGSLYV